MFEAGVVVGHEHRTNPKLRMLFVNAAESAEEFMALVDQIVVTSSD